eukprot:Clim_evm36s55 gene=Clim_evmTU36s55
MAATARQTPLTCHGHTRPVVDLDYSDTTEDGFFIISACKDGLPMLRKGDTGDWVGTFQGHKGAVWSAKVDRTATKAVTGSADFSCKVWNAVTGEEMMSLPHKHIVRAVSFTIDASKVVTACQDKKMRLFDLDNPENPIVEVAGHTGVVKNIYTVNDALWLSGSEDKTLKLWDAGTLENVKTVEVPGPVKGLTLTQDRQTVLAAHGNSVGFYSAQDLSHIKTVDIKSPVNSADWHPNGKKFVVGGEDFYLHVMDYESGEELEVYKGHHGPVHCVRFSPDGEIYASGSEDGTVRLWQTNVGQPYGLWQYPEHGNGGEANASNSEEIKA